jgi:hypothetical protein
MRLTYYPITGVDKSTSPQQKDCQVQSGRTEPRLDALKGDISMAMKLGY